MASVPDHWKVYSCVVDTLDAGLTVMPEFVGSTISLPPMEVTVILPVDVLAPVCCTR